MRFEEGDYGTGLWGRSRARPRSKLSKLDQSTAAAVDGTRAWTQQPGGARVLRLCKCSIFAPLPRGLHLVEDLQGIEQHLDLEELRGYVLHPVVDQPRPQQRQRARRGDQQQRGNKIVQLVAGQQAAAAGRAAAGRDDARRRAEGAERQERQGGL
jgi:hypothetical protein